MTMRPEDTDAALRALGVSARKSLGQNFVVDSTVIDRMVDHAGITSTTGVIEVGPGLGALTRGVAAVAQKVIAIEKDDVLGPYLSEQLQKEGIANVEIVAGDATNFPWHDLFERSDLEDIAAWVGVGNLPYNVAVPIIMGLLEHAPQISSLTVMVQLEVAQRLAASPKGRAIGLPTLQVNWFGTCEICFEIPPEAFVPAPHIDSAVIKITRDPAAPAHVDVGVTQNHVMAVAAQAYRQRRKMLRKSIGSQISEPAFEAAGIPGTHRPEELSIWDWIRLIQAERQVSQ